MCRRECGARDPGAYAKRPLRGIGHPRLELAYKMESLSSWAPRRRNSPFRATAFDVGLSRFVIEYVVFPARLLNEVWRPVRQGGLRPFRYDDGLCARQTELRTRAREVKAGKAVDALVTAYDTHVRLKALRCLRRRRVRRGKITFPILTDPRCLHLPGFVPDCDAVYPGCPERSRAT
jgi:hypothetical protein